MLRNHHIIQAEYAYGTVFISDKISKPRKPKATVALQVFVCYWGLRWLLKEKGIGLTINQFTGGKSAFTVQRLCEVKCLYSAHDPAFYK